MMSLTSTHSPRFRSRAPSSSLEDGELPRSPAALHLHDHTHFDFTSPRSWSTTEQSHALADSSFAQHMESPITRPPQPAMAPIHSPSSLQLQQGLSAATSQISIKRLPSSTSESSMQQDARDALQQSLSTEALTIAKDQPAQPAQTGYASASEESEGPLEVRRARRRAMVRPSPSPDPLPILGQDAELSLAATEFEVMARGTRHDANLSSSRSSMLLAKRFGEGAKYQFDVDWLDECDCCKQHNKRCYTSAGSLLRSTSCYNCYIRHWTCTVSNIRVNRKSTPAPRKRKSDVTTGKQTASTIELSSDSRFPAFTKQEHSTPITASTSTSQRRTSERAVRPPPHTPVLVTPLPQQPKPTRKRRKRGGPKKPAAEQARTTRYQSELSSPPHSDQEHLSNASASNNGLISQADSEGSCSVAGILCSSAEQAQEPDAEEGGDGIEENAIESSSVAEAHTSTLIHLTRARVNTLLLINDTAVAIQRCQRRLTQAPDNAGLLVIESAVDELVIELTRVVNPNHAAIVTGKRQHGP